MSLESKIMRVERHLDEINIIRQDIDRANDYQAIDEAFAEMETTVHDLLHALHGAREAMGEVDVDKP